MSKNNKLNFKELRISIGKGDLGKVIEILHDKVENRDHLNYLIGQSNRYYNLNKSINLNIINLKDADIERNKIVKSVLELIDEIEANENEEQKYMTNEDEIRLGVKVIYKEPNQIDILPKSSSNEWELEGLILRFLTVFDRWYFSPLRIKKWGGEQNGFGDLNNYSSKKIKSVLERLLNEGKIKKTISKLGNPIYKIL